jgi:hypothetical protein
MWQGVTLLTVGFAANQKKMAELKLARRGRGRS